MMQLKNVQKNIIKSANIDDIFKDQDIEIILNLTIPKAHFEVSEKALLSMENILIVKNQCVLIFKMEKNY